MTTSITLIFSGALSAQSSVKSQTSDNNLSVYSQKSKIELGSVNANSEFAVLESGVRWSMVKFIQPTVPVWVSSDFVRRVGNEAVITANRLNMRVGPSVTSPVLTSVAKGYRSPIIGTGDGFTQIYAPTDLTFALLTNEIRARSSLAPEGTNDTARSENLGSQNQWQTNTSKQVVEVEKTDAATIAPVVTNENSSLPVVLPEDQPLDVTDRLENSAIESADPSSFSRQHRLFPGDSISLSVFGEDELSIRNVRIPQSGQVSIPLLGAFEVAGKTTSEIEAELKQELSQGYVRNPRLSVTIDSYRPIFILGAASKIGSFQYSEGLTIAKAIAIAGGAKNSALEDGVSILRDGEVVEEGLPLNSQMRVLSGDIITLEEEEGVSEESSSYVYLHGEVRNPGEFEFRRGLTVEKAIVLAGGFTLRASRRKISVSRIIEGQEEPEKMKRVELHFPVQPGDIIDVGARWF